MSELQILVVLSGIVLIIIIAPNLLLTLKAANRMRRHHLRSEQGKVIK